MKALTLVPGILLLVSSGFVRAEASHHQAGAGQVVSTATTSALESLGQTAAPDWVLRLLPIVLSTDGGFDEHGMRIPLVAADRITLVSGNAYVERRLGTSFAVAAFTGWQVLLIDEAAGHRRVTSLGDSFLSGRYETRFDWGSLATLATVKIPGTYPESAATSTKQVDAEARLVASVPEFLSRVGIVVGVGYRLRLGGVKDEVVANVAVPVRLVDTVTLTASGLVGIAVGFGDVAKGSVIPGLTLGWRATPSLDLSIGYLRTVYGQNIAEANIVTASIGTVF